MSAMTAGWILMGLGLGGVFLSLLIFYLMIAVFVKISKKPAKAD